MQQLLAYIGRRLLFVIPQLLGILFVSFMLVKLIPGDPAVMMLGPFATQDGLAKLRAEMGLDRSILEQFYIVTRIVEGDLGNSWQTTMPVTTDLAQRFPATLELVTLSLLVALLIGIPLGVAGAKNTRGVLRKIADYPGLMAGAADFWFALVLIFVFYTMLGIAPAPLGQLDFVIIPPNPVTGSLLIDSLISGNWAAFRNAAGHLVLPVLTLGIINAGPILKMTQAAPSACCNRTSAAMPRCAACRATWWCGTRCATRCHPSSPSSACSMASSSAARCSWRSCSAGAEPGNIRCRACLTRT